MSFMELLVLPSRTDPCEATHASGAVVLGTRRGVPGSSPWIQPLLLMLRLVPQQGSVGL